MNAAIASGFGGERVVAGDQARARQRDDVVDMEHDGLAPVRSSWTGSLFAKPVAASTASCWTATPWPKSGYSTIVDVVGREAGRAEQRLEHDPRRAVLARDADLLAGEVRRPW